MTRSGISTSFRQSTNRPAHCLVGNLDETAYHLVQAQLLLEVAFRVHRLCNFFELHARGFDVERLFLRLAEYLGEIIDDEPTQQQICVCYCERSIFPICAIDCQ